MAISECQRCGFYDYDWGCCTCPDYEKFYACTIESKKPENQKELEEKIQTIIYLLRSSDYSDSECCIEIGKLCGIAIE